MANEKMVNDPSVNEARSLNFIEQIVGALSCHRRGKNASYDGGCALYGSTVSKNV